MNKRLLAFTLAMVTLMAMCFTGCGKDKEIDETNPYDYDLSEYITLADYVGLPVTAAKVDEITSDDIQKEIQKRLDESQQVVQEREGAIENGDKVFIDYVGTMDGEEFAGGNSNGQGYLLEIGSHSFIDGFEEGLIGKNIGDTVVLDLRFPNPYPNNMDLSDKPCQFTVEIHYKEVVVVPEYDLAWVEFHSNCKSLNEYEETVYDDLYAEALEKAQEDQKAELWNQVCENTKVIKYPAAEVEATKMAYLNYIYDYIAQFGYDMEGYLLKAGKTQSEFDADLDEYGKQVVLNEMVLYSIARAEGIEATQEEMDEAIEDILDEQGCTREEFENAYGAPIEQAISVKDLETSILLNKITDFLLENAIEQ